MDENLTPVSAARLEYTFSGRIEANYKGKLVKMTRALLSILEAPDGNISSIQLTAEFEPESAARLAADFVPMGAYESGFYTYAFEMKSEALNRHQAEFAEAIMPEDWLAIGPGACLNPENYICLGYGRI